MLYVLLMPAASGVPGPMGEEPGAWSNSAKCCHGWVANLPPCPFPSQRLLPEHGRAADPAAATAVLPG